MKIILSLCCIFSLLSPAWSGEIPARTPGRLRAGIYLYPPFVMERAGGGYNGMAIELWEEITDALDLHNDYVLYDDIADLVQDTVDGKIDVIAMDLSATHERAKVLKFSYPWYDAGLRIMVNLESGGSLWASLTRYRHLRVYLLFFLVFIVLTAILFFMRRRHDPEFSEDWREGLSQSFLNIVESALDGKMEQRHLGWKGNVFFIAWLLFGIAAVSYITSTMTSAMTGTRLNWDVQQPSDLPGKRIGVLHGSIGEEFVRSLNETPVSFAHLDDAVDALLKEDIDAIVSGAPFLEYHAHRNPQLPVAVVGDLFHPDKYCFASAYGNAELMDRVSVELIRLREAKRIEELKDKYFTGVEEEEALAWPGEE